jgi:hypothetical protein
MRDHGNRTPEGKGDLKYFFFYNPFLNKQHTQDKHHVICPDNYILSSIVELILIKLVPEFEQL